MSADREQPVAGDELSCAELSLAGSLAAAAALLRARVPGVVNPNGELVVVAPPWPEEIAHDPERIAYAPAALTALAAPTEIWRFTSEEPDGSTTEHQPHLLWCRPFAREPELFTAGTRRLGAYLHLHTWFRVDDPGPTLRRLWTAGSRVYPIRGLRPSYVARRDVLYLHPEPHVPYRATRLVPDVPLFGYLDARVGFPRLVGFELQDARRWAESIASGAAARLGVLGARWLPTGEVEPASLAELVARLTAR